MSSGIAGRALKDFLTPEERRIGEIFHPYAIAKSYDVVENNRRFVHYSSADAAMSMIQNNEIWMRRSVCMNDFSEIDHGRECLVKAFHGDSGKKLEAFLDDTFPGLKAEVVELFDSWFPHWENDTYLCCISEHRDDEDSYGRLSMWRAYGGTSGVAVVLNSGVFVRGSDALSAYTSPVAYLSVRQFADEFAKVVQAIEAERDLLKALGPEAMKTHLFQLFGFAVLCTKHPAFYEEQEWRVIFQPKYAPSTRLKKAVVSIRGIPQTIYKIPLVDVPDEGFYGAEIPDLVNRIIIGPTEYPVAIKDAFVALLEGAGVSEAASRVSYSAIPLRMK